MIAGESETTTILIVIGLAIIFFGLWIYSNRQKRKFEEAQRARKRELAKAAQANNNES